MIKEDQLMAASARVLELLTRETKNPADGVAVLLIALGRIAATRAELGGGRAPTAESAER